MLRATRYGEVTRFDVARTVAGRGWYWTAFYLVGDTLIDAGCAHARDEILAALQGVRVRRVVVTHSHEDHVGAAAALKRRDPDLAVLAHPRALPVLADPVGMQPLHLYRKVLWGQPEPVEARPVGDGVAIEAGDLRFVVIETPGHSADHLCFFEPERGWLFTGDLYIGGRERALRKGYRIREIIESLRRVASLPFRALFPGSARVPSDPRTAIADKVAYLEELGERVVALHRQGRTVHEVARALLGPPDAMEWATLGHFSRVWLVRSYLESWEPLRVEPRAASGDSEPTVKRLAVSLDREGERLAEVP